MATQFPTTDVQHAAAPIATSLRELCFTAERPDGGVHLWGPTDGEGGWEMQNRVGREYAREAIEFIRSTENAAVLPGIVRRIVDRGTFGEVKVGFFTALSQAV